MNIDVNMENPEFLEICICRRSFYTPGALKMHLRSCAKSKKRTFGALDQAKDLWKTSKRQRFGSSNQGGSQRSVDPQASDKTVEEASSPMLNNEVAIYK
jgi:hypothetical protein